MILENMTYADIARTMKSEFENELTKGYESCFGKRDVFHKKAMRLRVDEFQVFGYHTKVTRNMNKYIILFFSNGRNEYKMSGVMRHIRLEYQRSDGIHVAVPYLHDLNMASFYTPHFFERVRTRLLKDENISLAEVRNIYFSTKSANRIYRIDNPKYRESFFCVTAIGIALGERITEELWEFRTFISFEMLKSNQEVLAEEGIECIEEFKEASRNIPGLLALE